MKKLFYLSNLLTLCLILCASQSRAQVPTISVNPVSDTLCISGPASFTAFSSDTAVHYYWEVYNGVIWDSVRNGALYSGATTGTITFTATRSMNGYFYRAKAYNGAGMSAYSPYVPLIVDTIRSAGVISGLSSVCTPSSITLTTTGQEGVWSSSTAAATVSATGVVTGVSAGTTTISYDASNSCGTYLATHAVTVNTGVAHATLSGPSTLCTSSSIVVTASVAGGTWTISNGHATISPSGSVTGVTAGVDTITYTNVSLCNTDVVTKIITVEAPITAGSLTGPATVCVGSTISIVPSSPGGFWFSNDATVATTDLSGNITGRGQGHAIISYLFSNSCGSFTVSDTIEVERTASMITGTDSVSVGGTIMLADSALNGMWMSSDTSIAMVDTFAGQVFGIAPGTATITFSVMNVCGTSTATLLMHVGTAPVAGTLTGADSVCVGSSITLLASVPGGTWGVTNIRGTISPSGTFTGFIGGGKDTVTYTVSDAFGTSVITKVIYINTAPVITLSGVPAVPSLGTPYTISATPAGGTFTCDAPASKVYFISANTFVILIKDTFNIVYTVSNACGTSKDTIHVVLTPESAVNQVSTGSNNVSIYPNPSNGSFSLNLSSDFTEEATVVITNMVGEKVKEMTISTNKANDITLSQPAGMYLVTATTEHGRYTSRIVVSK